MNFVILYFSCLTLSVLGSLKDNTDTDHDHVLCRECGHAITDFEFKNDIISPLAVLQENSTLITETPILVQTLLNPGGLLFPVLTFRKAGCQHLEEWSLEATWFPGYYWSPCICPQCRQFIGWAFKRDPKAVTTDFYAIIETKVLSQEFVENLIVVPQSYKAR